MTTQQDIRVALPTEIIQVTGTVNAILVTWTREGDEWVTVADRSSDGKYRVEITAITSLAKEYTYNFTLYYGLILITDRTLEDVNRVIYLLKQWDSNQITEEEKIEYFGELKGCYDTSDLNRVGSAMYYIRDRLLEAGYPVKIESRNDWQMYEYVTQDDFKVYLSDVERLRSALAVLPTTPETPSPTENLDYEKANDIEKILLDVDDLISRMIAAYVYSGEVYAGEV